MKSLPQIVENENTYRNDMYLLNEFDLMASAERPQVSVRICQPDRVGLSFLLHLLLLILFLLQHMQIFTKRISQNENGLGLKEKVQKKASCFTKYFIYSSNFFFTSKNSLPFTSTAKSNQVKSSKIKFIKRRKESKVDQI